MSAFPKAAELAVLGSRAPTWRPGLGARAGAGAGAGADARAGAGMDSGPHSGSGSGPVSGTCEGLHGEIFASGREGSGAALALALALDRLGLAPSDGQDKRAVLWVQDAAAIRLTGRPCRAGLPEELRGRLIHVAAREAADVLFALEEGLRCRDFACVIGEIAGNPRALDFTASRRLSLAAEKHGQALFLVRLDAARDLSSARERWQVAAAPSPPPLWNRAAPGMPSWHAELFRSRHHAPGEWILRDERGRLLAERPPGYLPDHAAARPDAPDHGDLAGAAGG